MALNRTQVNILQLLAKSPDGLTRQEIINAGALANLDNLGPVELDHTQGDYSESLHARGLVEVEMVDGIRGHLWFLSDKGRKVAKFTKTNSKVEKPDKVPANILDPAVQAFRKTRTYGFEFYTDEDLAELRTILPDDYSEVSLEGLRVQITNRRKQGAYVDENEKKRKAIDKILREFGPEGTILQLLTDDQVMELEEYKERLIID